METVKLQKLLADNGLGSRRTIEEWISRGRIKVNRVIATIGLRVSMKDRIDLDGKRLRLQGTNKGSEWLIYHKPEGEVSTRRDTEKRMTVFHQLPRPRNGRWISVGRLDINTSGLLLFTTNGNQANYLMHPSNEMTRVYMVRIRGKLSTSEMLILKQGLPMEEGDMQFNSIEFAGGQNNNFWYKVSLKQGYYREIRRLFMELDHEVGRLMRIQYGDIELPSNLKRGQYRLLQVDKVLFLKNLPN